MLEKQLYELNMEKNKIHGEFEEKDFLLKNEIEQLKVPN